MSVTLLATGAWSVYGSTGTVYLNNEAGNQNTETYNGTTYPISPYGGTLGGSNIDLFCVDFADDTYWGTSWTVNVTDIGTAAAANPNTSPWAGTRDGSANANTLYPTGTTLYEELAWLMTQSIAPGQTVANQDAIQEAAWLMTDPNETDLAHSTTSGTNLSYLTWIQDAQTYYADSASQTPTQFMAPNYNDWYVLTDPAAAGNTGGKGLQEMLAYYTSTTPFNVGTMQSTPEPSTMALFGLALVAAGLSGRRKRRSL